MSEPSMGMLKKPPAAFSPFCRAHVRVYALRVKRAAALLDGLF